MVSATRASLASRGVLSRRGWSLAPCPRRACIYRCSISFRALSLFHTSHSVNEQERLPRLLPSPMALSSATQVPCSTILTKRTHSLLRPSMCRRSSLSCCCFSASTRVEHNIRRILLSFNCLPFLVDFLCVQLRFDLGILTMPRVALALRSVQQCTCCCLEPTRTFNASRSNLVSCRWGIYWRRVNRCN